MRGPLGSDSDGLPCWDSRPIAAMAFMQRPSPHAHPQ